jgi:hypothetical protein
VPIDYARSDDARQVVLIVDGPFEKSEIAATLVRHTDERAWDYGLLWDLRRMIGRPTYAELVAFRSQYVDWLPADAGTRGPVAVVADTADAYGAACLYAIMVRPKLTIEVFRHRREAETWIDSRINRAW